MLLHQRILKCKDDVEFELLRQSWDVLNRPKYSRKIWSDEQAEALRRIRVGVSFEDEVERDESDRFLHVSGKPGSGKNAVLLEAAVEHCKSMSVLIICPTGAQVYGYKSKLPDVDGIENVRVDTMHGVLQYPQVF